MLCAKWCFLYAMSTEQSKAGTSLLLNLLVINFTNKTNNTPFIHWLTFIMYKKCFAVAILAVLTPAEFLLTPSPKRGSGDGSDRDNAIYNDFISRNDEKIKTDVYTWIGKSADDDDTLVFHGETIIYGGSLPPTFTYGFCLENNVGLAGKITCQNGDT